MAIAGELNDPDNILGQEKDEGTIRGEKTLAYIKKLNKEKK